MEKEFRAIKPTLAMTGEEKALFEKEWKVEFKALNLVGWRKAMMDGTRRSVW